MTPSLNLHKSPEMELDGLPPELLELLCLTQRRIAERDTDKEAILIEEEIEKVQAYLNIVKGELYRVLRKTNAENQNAESHTIRELQDQLAQALKEKDNWLQLLKAPVNTTTWSIRKEVQRVVSELDSRITLIEARLRAEANDLDKILICPSQNSESSR